MCGVFGYIGERNAVEVCCHGLELLEYRGYDSTGIAGVSQGRIDYAKRAGKLTELKQILEITSLDLAIAHTRWATHGAVTDKNAHPHLDETHSFAIIHNGIIENYASLREALQKEGVVFSSDTDTEVIVQLVAKKYRGDLVHALYETLPLLEGNFSLLLIHKDHPKEIVAAAFGCPLAIGVDDEKTEVIVSSDPNAFFGAHFNVVFLQNGEIARIQKGKIGIYGKGLMKKKKKSERTQGNLQAPSKEGFEHFMLKEIFQQPSTIQKAMTGRFDKTVVFEELTLSPKIFEQMQRVFLLGSGTSAHAGMIGAMLLEDLAKLPAFCEIASEARYRTTLFSPKTLGLAISQSGETADTLAALREMQKHRSKVLSICNVENSAMVREADGSLFLKAGPEISVCSTKAFTSHLVMLALFALQVALLKKQISTEKAAEFYADIELLPKHVAQVLDQTKEIERIGKKYAKYDDFFFMGRRYMYPTCLEAALKLKEISYVNANGYPAGELKHGPIALLDAKFPVVAFCANLLTQEKILSNLMEVKARGAPVFAIAPTSCQAIQGIADDVIWVPPIRDELAPFSSIVVGQLFAYFLAKERGCEIDQPRNLAKSVTVE